MITTEALFCSPLAFGAGIYASGGRPTPVQRAICRAADGLPLGDLANDPAVLRSFGGEEAILRLPNEPPKELFCVCCIRGGKSLLAACIAFKIALTIDMSFMGKGEVGRVSLVATDKDKAGACFSHLMIALELEGGILGQFLVKTPKPTTERVRIRRLDGRVVEIVVAAGKRAGASLISRWTLAAVFDEAARLVGSSSGGVVNFADMRSGVIGRLSLVRGAQLVVVTSPWIAEGPVYEAVRDHHGRPTKYMVVVRAPGPDMNPSVWTPEAVEEMRGDPSKEQEFQSDALGNFVNIESGWLIDQDIEKSLNGRTADTLEPADGVYYVAAMDAGLKGNSWTLVILGVIPDNDPGRTKYFVALTWQATGSRANPLNVEETLGRIRRLVREFAVTDVWTDSWGSEFIRQAGDTVGVNIRVDDDTTAEKDQRHIMLKATMLAGHFEGSPETAWRADMISARIRRTPNGEKLELPLTRDGRHADYVPATLLAFSKGSIGPGWADLFTKWNAAGRPSR